MLIAVAGVSFLAAAGVARAHDATVTCDPSGSYRVVADYQQYTPTSTFTDTTVTVTWTDGYRLVLPLPTPCAPPMPTVVPDVPAEPVIPVIPAPSGSVEPMPRVHRSVPKPVRPRKKPRVVTCSFVLQHYRGKPRAAMIAKYRLPKTCGRAFNPPVAG